MTARIYDFPPDKSTTRAIENLTHAMRELAPDLRTLAEAERRRSVIRTCRMVARRQRRGRDDR